MLVSVYLNYNNKPSRPHRYPPQLEYREDRNAGYGDKSCEQMSNNQKARRLIIIRHTINYSYLDYTTCSYDI
jgi:hypothetical protein